jgi:restriction endonuclease S subunit
LRKILLDEAQLKAVISLPQGLFVSKSGQGPKTSILIFEKGVKTDWTWFYKITNDGYTMGTNRKEQKGNQLIECLTLWHEYVKHGKQPPETKNQFCIPAEWIKTLDPRIKEKIRTETRADMEAKGKIEREKKEADLDKKIKAKKATEADKSMELKTFDHMLENRIQNEIAKRIDKAHNYSFNLANYKSTISDSQIVEWTEALKHIQPNGAITVEEVYKKLNNGRPENILPYLLKLNPTNALEADIAREYVSNLDNVLIEKHKELNVIKEILKSGAKYPMVKLKDYLILNENKIKPNRIPDVNYKVLGVSNEVGIFLNEKLQAEETNQSYFVVAKNEFCYNPYRINVGSIGLNTNDYDNQIISGAYIVFACKEDELNPKYLDTLFKSKGFLNYVNDKANGGVRMNFKFEDMEAWEIPLPSLDEQNTIIAQIEKYKGIIDGADLVLKNNEFKIEDILMNGESYLFSDIVESIDAGINFSKADLSVNKEGIPYIKMQNIQNGRIDVTNFELAYVEENIDTLERYVLKDGDLLFNVRNSFELVGKMAIYQGIPKSAIYNHMLLRIRLKDFVLSSFVNYMFQTVELNEKLNLIKKGSTSIWAVYQKDLNKISIKLPDIETQQKIVDELDAKSQILEGLRKMKTEAQNKINQILADVWGVEFIEPEKELVEDEQEN